MAEAYDPEGYEEHLASLAASDEGPNAYEAWEMKGKAGVVHASCMEGHRWASQSVKKATKKRLPPVNLLIGASRRRSPAYGLAKLVLDDAVRGAVVTIPQQQWRRVAEATASQNKGE